MSSISSISGVNSASLWSTSTSTTSSTSSAADTFSQIVSNLQSGGSATSSDSSSSDEDTVTTIRTLSDGSLLITVTKGEEIISETKTRPTKPQKEGQDPTLLGTTSEIGASMQAATVDKFNDTSTSITAGSLFSADI